MFVHKGFPSSWAVFFIDGSGAFISVCCLFWGSFYRAFSRSAQGLRKKTNTKVLITWRLFEFFFFSFSVLYLFLFLFIFIFVFVFVFFYTYDSPG